MASTQGKSDGAARLIDTIQDAENHSPDAVRKFLDTVDGAFPDLSHDNDGPRRKIIDSAFKMTEQLVGASNDLARTVLDLTQTAMKDSERETATSKK